MTPPGALPDPEVTAAASPAAAAPEATVTISFTPDQPNWVIDECSATLGGTTYSDCVNGTLTVRVPPAIQPGATTINWRAHFYYHDPVPGTHDGVRTGERGNDLAFTVLEPDTGTRDGSGPSPSPSASPTVVAPPVGPPVGQPIPVPRSSSGKNTLPLSVPLLMVLLAAAAIATTLITRRTRRGADRPPRADDVRAVPHVDTDIQVTVPEAHRSLTHIVRLDPHHGIADVNVQEVRK